MELLVLRLCQITFFSSVTAGLLLLVKHLCKFHISPQLHVAMWLILFIRVFVPFLPESVHSVYNYVPGCERVVDGTVLQADFYPPDVTQVSSTEYLNHLLEKSEDSQKISGVPEFARSVSQTISASAPDRGAESDICLFVFIVYVLGASVCLLRMFIHYHSLYHKTLRTSVQCDNQMWNSRYVQIARDMGFRTRRIPNLYVGTAPSMLLGIIRPIVLVNAHTDERDLSMVFAHELNHCRYGDNFLIFLSTLLAALLWFNPLIWIACRNIQDDLEILCDSYTVRLPFVNTKEYAVLLYQSTCPGVVRAVHVASNISTESVLLKKRLKRLAGGATSAFSRILSGFVCVVLITACLTNPVYSLVANNDIYVRNGSSLVGSELVPSNPNEGISGIRFYNIVYTTLKNKTGGDASPIPSYLGDGTLTSLTRHAKENDVAFASFDAYMLGISRTNSITYEQAAVLLDTVIRLIDHSLESEHGSTIPVQIRETSFVYVLSQLPDAEARALLSCYNRGCSNSTVTFSTCYTEEKINEISSRIANDWLREKFLMFYYRTPLDQLPEGFCEENNIVTSSDSVYRLFDTLSEREIQIVRDIVSIAQTGVCEDIFYLKGRCDVYSEEYMDALYDKVGFTRADVLNEYAIMGVSGYSDGQGTINWMTQCDEIYLKNHGSSPQATLAVLSVCRYGLMSPTDSYLPYNQALCFGEAMRALCLLYAGMGS